MPLNEVKVALQQVVAIWDDPHNFAEGFSEKLTCHSLIHPVLEALGWNLQTGSQVVMEYLNPEIARESTMFFSTAMEPPSWSWRQKQLRGR